MDEITPSPFAVSFAPLTPIMRLQAPEEIAALAADLGLARIPSPRLDLPSGKQFQTLEFVRHTVQLAYQRYDCNNGEILEDLGQTLRLCYDCLKESDDLDEDELCPSCRI